jgi:hypothetical protein
VSDRVFGFVWCSIIGFFTLLPLWRGEAFHISLAVVAVLLALIASSAPGLLSLPNRLWTRFGKIMHGVTSSVVLFLIYFLFFTPGAALLRLCGRTQLKRDFDPEVRTYWAERPSVDTDFTRPY